MSRLEVAWEGYWFRPLPAARPAVFEHVFLVLLAFDVWILRIPAAGLRDDFNVPHFAWLDVLHPAPTVALYVSVLLAVGLLSLLVAFGGGSLALRLLLLAAYTDSWAMSRLDGFQHHYLLSWVLLCVVFFPRGRASGRTEAWSWALLGVSLAIVYGFTAVTKIDPAWLDGSMVRSLAFAAGTAPAFETWSLVVGLTPATLWPAVAVSVIAAELLIATAYLVAPRQDDVGAGWRRGLAATGGAVAMGLHAGIEVFLDLQIGWFSAYALLGAATFFLPERWLEKLWESGTRVPGAIRRSLVRVTPAFGERFGGAASLGVMATVMFLVAGIRADLPGAFAATALVAALVIVDGTLLLALGRRGCAATTLAAAATAALLMVTTLEVSPARFDFYDRLAGELVRRGDRPGALAAYERLSLYAPRFPAEEPVRVFVRERRMEALEKGLVATDGSGTKMIEPTPRRSLGGQEPGSRLPRRAGTS